MTRKPDGCAMLSIVAVFLLLFGAFIWMVGRESNRFYAACRAAGGIPDSGKSGAMCLRPDAVIRLP